ncbi:hypothetical protein F4781DRAFT_166574 [Annulohypoxylon bovei var. microspora]|nr:hypothetical protein F4781DRAFT_166574 [Annulohypoxylon bovei var. microspora]
MDATGLAITVAGCALKLVAFSIDFVADAKQVYQKGATDRNLDLAMVSNSIQNATKNLESQLDKFKGKSQERNVDSVELDIRTLAARAAAIGNELTSRLHETHTDSKSKRKILKAVGKGLWDNNDIEGMEKRLNRIRKGIEFIILVDFRRYEGSQSDEIQRILSTLEQTANSLSESKEDSRTIMEMLSQVNESIKGLQQSINTSFASGQPGPGATAKSEIGQEDGKLRVDAEDTVLRLLWYPSIQDRYQSISTAYSKTLEWIYKNPNTNDEVCKWDSFVDFLQGETRMYWITGKAGSGKSTLMKFINEHKQTKETLMRSAGDKGLICASFYFFYKGSDEQKSELGLLRSLLHQILSRRRELISLLFKERLHLALEHQQQTCITLHEAKSAVERLFEENRHRFFFLAIDGLDEFDPEISLTHVASLIKLTEMMGNFSNVKLLVSSRQLPEFEHAFERYPRLRIHDLTKNDIRHYSTERLERNEHMQRLIKRDPVNSGVLIDSITSMSSGVFLWVRVVTESLLQGLTNCDEIHDLQTRLSRLPPDLQDLYKVMLLRVDNMYRRQTCELLQLVYFSTLGNIDLNALGLFFAEREKDNMTNQAKLQADDNHKLKDYAEAINQRLRSRCLGLIELDRDCNRSTTGGDLRKTGVSFLHKTVAEFLGGDIWESFVVVHCHPKFDPHRCLLSSAVDLFDYTVQNLRHEIFFDHGLECLDQAVFLAKYTEHMSKRAYSDLLQKLDSTATAYYNNPVYYQHPGSAQTNNLHWSYIFEGKKGEFARYYPLLAQREDIS